MISSVTITHSSDPLKRYSFPGYPIFIQRATREIGCVVAERPIHRTTTLTAMANLCAQATTVDPKNAPAILEKALELRDQLHVALHAADLILQEVRDALQETEALCERPQQSATPSRKVRK